MFYLFCFCCSVTIKTENTREVNVETWVGQAQTMPAARKAKIKKFFPLMKTYFWIF